MDMLTLIVIYIIASAGLFYLLWIFYLAVMNLARAKRNGTLSKTALYLGTPVLVIGFTLDVIINVFVMTPMMLELPKELTVSSRLKRHNQDVTTEPWRKAIVRWFESILDAFDPSGNHI